MATTLSFIGLDKTGHTVSIGKGNFQLVGTTQPFVIQEDDNIDLMTPIRKKSGYVNFLDSGSTWQSLVPTSSTDITVECDDFFGFVCPDTYGGRFLYRPAEFSLAVVCPASVLSGFKLSYSQWQHTTIGFLDLVDLIVGQLSTESGVTFGTSWNDGGHAMYRDFAHLKIQWESLFANDDDYASEAKYNNYDLLNDICVFLGVTCRCVGRTFTFVALDLGTFSDTYTATDFELADIESTEELIQGYGQTKVKSSISEERFIDMPNSRITDQNLQVTGVTARSWAYHGNGAVVYFLKNTGESTYTAYVPQSYNFNDIGFNAQNNYFLEIFIDTQARSIDSSPFGKDWRCVIQSINLKLADPNSYVEQNPSDLSVFWGKHRKFMDSGFIEITGRAHYFEPPTSGNSNFNDETPNINMVAMVKVGDMWYNGTSWESTPSNRIPYFCIRSNGGALGKMMWASQTGQPISYFEEGYKVPIDAGMEGDIMVGIGPCLGIEGDKDYIYIEGLQAEYKRDNGYRDKTDASRRSSNSTKFAESKELDVIFCQDGPMMKAGPELLLYDNARYYGGANDDEDLLQRLANRISTIGSKARHVINLNLRDSDPKAGAGVGSLISYAGKSYYPLAISKDPGRGMTTLKLVEL